RQVVCSGPILQHGSRQNAEGQGDYDANSYWLESQRLSGLYIGRSNAAGVHCGCTHRCQLSRNGLRSSDRPIPNTESEKREPHERTTEGERPNPEPSGYDRVSVEKGGLVISCLKYLGSPISRRPGTRRPLLSLELVPRPTCRLLPDIE